ncbi:PIN domain-containing protein [Armatimonas sp.]|uniref:PIN domain-containing protein n=1 Tax=Armatimonas sp. TaxID=1872638 RepID=UPI00286D3816|nr:PIN domain-containing protein [Armatimonas sp.]
MAVPVTLLDANVLYPAPLRDFLLQLAYADFFDPKWSEEIQDEWTRNVLANRSDLTAAQMSYTRDAMKRAFPTAIVTGYEFLIAQLTNHPKDAHVLAAAIQGKAQCIVTFNLKDFPATALIPYGVEAIPPDEFALSLYHGNPEDVIATLGRHRAKLTRPPKSAREYVDSLEHCGLIKTAKHLREHEDEI